MKFREGHQICHLLIHGRPYEINFRQGKQLNQRTQRSRKIRFFVDLPNHWDMNDEDALELLKEKSPQAASSSSQHLPNLPFPLFGPTHPLLNQLLSMSTMDQPLRFQANTMPDSLRKVSDEVFQRLAKVLNASRRRHDGSRCLCPHGSRFFQLIEAYQVKNLYLWRRYQRFVRSMHDKHKQYSIIPEEIDPIGDALDEFASEIQVDLVGNERLLFHGTRDFNLAKAIATEGFDNRIANGGLYGYLALRMEGRLMVICFQWFSCVG